MNPAVFPFPDKYQFIVKRNEFRKYNACVCKKIMIVFPVLRTVCVKI